MSWESGSYWTSRMSAVYSPPSSLRSDDRVAALVGAHREVGTRGLDADGTGVSPWPYITPGIRPAARALRAPPLPSRRASVPDVESTGHGDFLLTSMPGPPRSAAATRAAACGAVSRQTNSELSERSSWMRCDRLAEQTRHGQLA